MIARSLFKSTIRRTAHVALAIIIKGVRISKKTSAAACTSAIPNEIGMEQTTEAARTVLAASAVTYSSEKVDTKLPRDVARTFVIAAARAATEAAASPISTLASTSAAQKEAATEATTKAAFAAVVTAAYIAPQIAVAAPEARFPKVAAGMARTGTFAKTIPGTYQISPACNPQGRGELRSGMRVISA